MKYTLAPPEEQDAGKNASAQRAAWQTLAQLRQGQVRLMLGDWEGAVQPLAAVAGHREIYNARRLLDLVQSRLMADGKVAAAADVRKQTLAAQRAALLMAGAHVYEVPVNRDKLVLNDAPLPEPEPERPRPAPAKPAPKKTHPVPEVIESTPAELAKLTRLMGMGGNRIRFRCYVDGSTELHLQGSKLWFVHRTWMKPGYTEKGKTEVTLVNGQKWDPTWHNNTSSKAELVGIAVPNKGSPTVKVEQVQARGSVKVKQHPAEDNDYTAVILMDDGAIPAQAWYEFVITWTP